jgi:HSP20 family protein
MDIKKLNPWNWFKHEEDGERRNVPVRRQSDRQLSAYTPLLSLHQEIDRVFDHVFRHFGWPSFGAGAARSPLESNLFRPSVDIDATDKEYRITVEVPGVDEKDLSLELGRDGTLTVKGEKKQEREENGRDFYRVERSYGSFQRVLALPEDANQAGISAHFKNGVLTVSIPRRAIALPEVRRISINTGRDTLKTGT